MSQVSPNFLDSIIDDHFSAFDRCRQRARSLGAGAMSARDLDYFTEIAHPAATHQRLTRKCWSAKSRKTFQSPAVMEWGPGRM